MKKTLGYIAFTFLLFFMCGINVKAKSYTVCDYEVGNDETIRLYYQNGSLYYGASQLHSGKWKYGDKLHMTDQYEKSGKYYIFYIGEKKDKSYHAVLGKEGSEESFNSIKQITSKCPTIYWFTNLSSNTPEDRKAKEADKQRNYTLLDLECKYDKNGSWDMKSDFAGVNGITGTNAPTFLVDNTSYNFKYHFAMAPGSDELDVSRNYSDQTYMINYLIEADQYGCPKNIVAGKGYGKEKWYYLTYNSSVSDDDIKSINPRGDNSTYKSYGLVCNTNYATNYKNELNDYYTRTVNTAEVYNYDWSNWKEMQANASENCASKTSKGDFVECYIDDAKNRSVNAYQAMTNEGTYFEKATKAGCTKEDLAIDNDIKKVWNDLFQKLYDNGIIAEEAKEKLQNDLDEQMKKIEEAKDALFKATGLNELKATKSEKKETISCNELFGSASDEDSLMSFIVWIFNILRFLVPVILIILGSIDFGKVVLSNDKEAMSKALSTFVIRVIIAIAIFLLPTLISLILRILSNAGVIGKDAISCIIGDL